MPVKKPRKAPTSPLHERHAELGAEFAECDGWLLPAHYGSAVEEHLAVREDAGAFDLSHLGQLAIRWSWSHDYLQTRLANDLDRIEPGQSQYTLVTDEEGNVADDLLAFRLDGGYLLTVNAASLADDLELLAEMTDVSADWSVIAVQGPNALERLGVEIERHRFRREAVLGVDCLLSGTGYTGEPGCELLCNTADAPLLWDRVLEVGIRPCGMLARDSLRLEMGYVRHGHDLTRDGNPYQAGLGEFVRVGKNFVGVGPLRKLRRRPPSDRLVSFVADDETVPPVGAEIHGGGVVTSSAYSPILERGIGMGYVWAGVANAGKRHAVLGPDGPIPVTLVHRPRETPPRPGSGRTFVKPPRSTR